MRPLGWLSPSEFIEKYKSQEESLFLQYKVLKVFILNRKAGIATTIMATVSKSNIDEILIWLTQL